MSSRHGHADSGAEGTRRPREPRDQELQRRREQKRRRRDAQQLQQLKHLESFYEKPPPGLIKEDETRPEDCIPDVPGNEHAREFLAHAPTKGLWMPLGKEVKVMQCECGSASSPPEHTQVTDHQSQSTFTLSLTSLR
ncbi:RP9 pre-mRNA splicing factor [Phyllostomus discolor]|uniref:RP9 pre-mRNA splicing factor n=1 Tax=Phyllostomus discolor TaxID=89673 RepID=A0A833Z147_9CHIR|nr:RP9 pre-mRNA splicing factor [Phyllostomus discolor]